MNMYHGLPLVAPRVIPSLDPSFRPAVLACRSFRAQVKNSGRSEILRLALEQADGTVSHFATELFAEGSTQAAANFPYLERILKLLLWARGGFRVHFHGPPRLA